MKGFMFLLLKKFSCDVFVKNWSSSCFIYVVKFNFLKFKINNWIKKLIGKFVILVGVILIWYFWLIFYLDIKYN